MMSSLKIWNMCKKYRQSDILVIGYYTSYTSPLIGLKCAFFKLTFLSILFRSINTEPHLFTICKTCSFVKSCKKYKLAEIVCIVTALTLCSRMDRMDSRITPVSGWTASHICIGNYMNKTTTSKTDVWNIIAFNLVLTMTRLKF